MTVSAGVATYPMQGSGRDELIRLADSALYWAKKDGKNRVRAYAAESILRANLEQLADTPDRAAQYRAAESLAKAVDERDAYTGSHSQRVGEYSARIARRLGADEPAVELTRLAGNLHDLGKLAIPEEVLRKADSLNEAERLMLERHPQIGFRMLESLGVQPVAEWVLHHHERWDGAGYPNRLAGDQIPLGARIIFVADAYDAMTSDRDYRQAVPPRDALAELERCAGTQFDPAVVKALAEELGPHASPTPPWRRSAPRDEAPGSSRLRSGAFPPLLDWRYLGFDAEARRGATTAAVLMLYNADGLSRPRRSARRGAASPFPRSSISGSVCRARRPSGRSEAGCARRRGLRSWRNGTSRRVVSVKCQDPAATSSRPPGNRTGCR